MNDSFFLFSFFYVGVGLNVGFTVELWNKTATRLPENLWVRFNPSSGSNDWSMSVLSESVDPLFVVNNGSRHLHAVSENGILWTPADKLLSMQILSQDAAVVGFGYPWGFPVPLTADPDIKGYGASFCLWNNLWGTNYVMWYPFENEESEKNLKFEFQLKFRAAL
jgi:hypothetical protein